MLDFIWFHITAILGVYWYPYTEFSNETDHFFATYINVSYLSLIWFQGEQYQYTDVRSLNQNIIVMTCHDMLRNVLSELVVLSKFLQVTY